MPRLGYGSSQRSAQQRRVCEHHQLVVHERLEGLKVQLLLLQHGQQACTRKGPCLIGREVKADDAALDTLTRGQSRKGEHPHISANARLAPARCNDNMHWQAVLRLMRDAYRPSRSCPHQRRTGRGTTPCPKEPRDTLAAPASRWLWRPPGWPVWQMASGMQPGHVAPRCGVLRPSSPTALWEELVQAPQPSSSPTVCGAEQRRAPHWTPCRT